MENDYCVFIVNYLMLMHRNSVNFMKITTEFTNFGCEFCLVSRPNNNSHLTAVFPRTTCVGRHHTEG